MRPKRRPPRPKHPKFTYFHRSGLRFGRFPAQRRSIGGVGRHRRAWPRCRWVAAGPGRASRRRVELPNSNPAPQVWRAPEGPEGTAAVPVGGGRARAGLEIDHSEPSGSRVAISRAGRRPPAHTAAGPHKAARPDKSGPTAPGTPVGATSSPTPQQDPTAPGTPVGATSNPAQQAAKNGYDSETSPRGSRRDRPR